MTGTYREETNARAEAFSFSGSTGSGGEYVQMLAQGCNASAEFERLCELRALTDRGRTKIRFAIIFGDRGATQGRRAPPEATDTILHPFLGVPERGFERMWRHIGSPLGTIGAHLASLLHACGRPWTEKVPSGPAQRSGVRW